MSQVKVTLKALDEHIRPAERVILLTPNSPSFKIGRASKSISKGLQAASDNAWFDSPVMSRFHAEISFNVEEELLTITDTESMHGTHLNEHTLQVKTPSPIDSGDVVVFGAEVKRGPEIFPACAFSINYEFLPYRSANTFAFPDSSDLEDEEEEEDYELSDEDMDGQERQVSSDDGVSIQLVAVKASQNSVAIDLTRDDSPVSRPNNVIDLSGDMPMETNDARPRASENQANLTAPSPTRVGFEGDEEDGDYSTDSESLSRLEIQDSAPFGIVIDSDEESSEEEDEEDGEEELFVGRPSIQTQASESGPYSGNVQRVMIADSYENDDFYEEEVLSGVEGDYQGDVGLSDAGAEGLRAMFEDDLQSNDDIPFGFTRSQAEGHDRTQASVLLAPSSILLMDGHQEEIVTPFQPSIRLPSVQTGRQPSPSDAAMVKILDESSVQILGDKSGKAAYFNAREANKARFQQTGDSIELPNTISTFRLTGTLGMSLGDQIKPVSAMPTRDQCAFLDTPDLTSVSAREVSPQPDMTSAVVYNNSKQSLAAAAKTSRSRSGIKINDIIETPSLNRTEGLKRKVDDISETSTDELKIWANNSPNGLTSPSVLATSTTQEKTSREGLADVATAIASVPSDNRPTKRQKFLEIVGYTALGGVTIGAGVFAALVATAPSFQSD